MKLLVLGFTVVALLMAAHCFIRWCHSRRARNQLAEFYTWRERQQSKWRVKHPSVQYDENPKWDGDIPVFASKEQK